MRRISFSSIKSSTSYVLCSNALLSLKWSLNQLLPRKVLHETQWPYPYSSVWSHYPHRISALVFRCPTECCPRKAFHDHHNSRFLVVCCDNRVCHTLSGWRLVENRVQNLDSSMVKTWLQPYCVQKACIFAARKVGTFSMWVLLAHIGIRLRTLNLMWRHFWAVAGSDFILWTINTMVHRP